LGATAIDFAAYSMLRWVSSATIASSFFCSNFEPCPFI
jgi:hypothetical protein